MNYFWLALCFACVFVYVTQKAHRPYALFFTLWMLVNNLKISLIFANLCNSSLRTCYCYQSTYCIYGEMKCSLSLCAQHLYWLWKGDLVQENVKQMAAQVIRISLLSELSECNWFSLSVSSTCKTKLHSFWMLDEGLAVSSDRIFRVPAHQPFDAKPVTRLLILPPLRWEYGSSTFPTSPE